MKVSRQFERRGPLWLPRYDVERPLPPNPRERGLPRFERYRRRQRIGAAWSHNNGVTNYSASSITSLQTTLGFTPPAGSLLICMAAGYTSSSATISVSDNSSGPADSWSSIVSAGTWSSKTLSPFQAFACNLTSGTAPTSVTVSFGSVTSTYTIVVIDCYTGGPNPFQQDGNGVPQSGDSTGPSASFTTGSQANDLIWCGMLTYGAPSSASVASPFTVETQGQSLRCNSADDGITNSTAASTQYTATWTLGGSSRYWCEVLAGFQAPSTSFQPDEDYWQWGPPSAPDAPATVFE